MNIVDAVLADDLMFVHVKFSDTKSARTYAYKTLDKSIKEDDSVVIKTNEGLYKVVKVISVGSIYDFEYDANIHYKWVVSKLNTEQYDEAVRREKEIMFDHHTSQIRKKREELLADFKTLKAIQ